MKKLLVLAVMLTGMVSTAQKQMDTYVMDYFNTKEFKIDVSEDKNKEITIWLEPSIMDKHTKDISVAFTYSRLLKFESFLLEAVTKFEEWSKIAKENNVEVNKTIPDIKAVSKTFFKPFSEWKIDSVTPLYAEVKTISGEFVLVIRNKHKLTAYDNKYISSEGFAFAFKSRKSVEELISKIQITKAREFLDKQNSKNDLFN